EKAKGKKKIAWIHTDYSYIDVDVVSELDMWSKYDRIVSISEKVTEAFLKKFPELADRIVLIKNIHPSELVKKQADEFGVSNEMPDDGYIKFLSVGRYTDAKNFDNVPDICRRLDNVKWYIIGYGGDEELIRKKIAEAGMEDRVVLLGKKTNPYPYFKACDFYVQPSRYEGNSVTVNEALILGKKVAITNYATAKSQIDDGVNGVIVPLENEKCAEGLKAFIENTELQKKIEENIKISDFSNSDEFKKLVEITEG
ncbi:MAG: glycosyltransferase, partial [Acutalibacteraceae bacterium]|nr:glycosyltransferase [Acutalibacteraceae bacterium]